MRFIRGKVRKAIQDADDSISYDEADYLAGFVFEAAFQGNYFCWESTVMLMMMSAFVGFMLGTMRG